VEGPRIFVLREKTLKATQNHPVRKSRATSAKNAASAEPPLALAPFSRNSVGMAPPLNVDTASQNFIVQARAIGFNDSQARELLGLYQDGMRSSQQAKSMAKAHIEWVKQKTQELHSTLVLLEYLVSACHGDGRPGCPILKAFAVQGSPVADLQEIGSVTNLHTASNGSTALLRARLV